MVIIGRRRCRWVSRKRSNKVRCDQGRLLTVRWNDGRLEGGYAGCCHCLPVALFGPRVGVVVVAVALPEPRIVVGAELQPA